MIAEDHAKSGIPAYKPADIVLEQELKAGNYMKIRCRNIILQVRHSIANIIKASKLYQWIKEREKRNGNIRTKANGRD